MKCNCNASQWYIVVALTYLICCRGCASRCDDMLQIAVALICTWQTRSTLWCTHDHCRRRCRLNRVASQLGDTFSLCTSFMLRYILLSLRSKYFASSGMYGRVVCTTQHCRRQAAGTFKCVLSYYDQIAISFYLLSSVCEERVRLGFQRNTCAIFVCFKCFVKD